MGERNDAAYSGPLSPEEKAECDRELAEMRRKLFEDLDKSLDERIQRTINRTIDRTLNRTIDRTLYDCIDFEAPPALAKALRRDFPNSPLNDTRRPPARRPGLRRQARDGSAPQAVAAVDVVAARQPRPQAARGA